MSRPRSPKRKKALKLWIDSGRTMTFVEVAEKMGVSDAQIRKWKFEDNWDEAPDRRPRGGQQGNKNAVGNNGGAPIGNQNSANPFRRFLPNDPDYLEILDMVQNMDPLDMIWHGVESSFATLIRMERIMYVENKGEMIKELKKRKYEIHDVGEDKPKLEQVVTEEEYEFQWSWDRYMTYVKAQTTTLSELRAGIRQFLSLAPEYDERRAKLELMQAQADKIRAEIKASNPSGDKRVNIVDDIPAGGKR